MQVWSSIGVMGEEANEVLDHVTSRNVVLLLEADHVFPTFLRWRCARLFLNHLTEPR